MSEENDGGSAQIFLVCRFYDISIPMYRCNLLVRWYTVISASNFIISIPIRRQP